MLDLLLTVFVVERNHLHIQQVRQGRDVDAVGVFVGVVVVDDQPVNRDILERQMQLLGVQVTSCASGAEALGAMDASVDLVLSDHNMPGMDGLELTKHIQDKDVTVPVVED